MNSDYIADMLEMEEKDDRPIIKKKEDLEPEPQKDLKLFSKSRTLLLALIIAMGNCYGGYCDGIFNPMALPLLEDVYGMDHEKDKDLIIWYEGAYNAAFAMGALVGALIVGTLSNKFGRRPILFAGEFIAVLNCLVLNIEDKDVLIGGRFFSGLVTGMANVGFVIISELLPNSVSGFGNSSGYVLAVSCMLLGFASQKLLGRSGLVKYWRYILCLTIFVSIIRLTFLPFLLKTDTPKYVYTKSSPEKVKDNLYSVFSRVYTEEDAKLATDLAITTFRKQDSEAKIGLGEMFRKGNRLRFFSGCFLAFAQQFNGINFFIYYSTKIFNQINGTGEDMTLVIGISNVVGGVLALYLISKTGRKFNLVLGCFTQATALCFILVGIRIDNFILTAGAACVFISAFAFGLGGSYQAYMCEILPPSGVGFAVSLQWFFTAVVAQSTPFISDHFGQVTVLAFFAGASFLLFLGLSLVTIETKGKLEYQIVDKFKKGKLKCFDFK